MHMIGERERGFKILLFCFVATIIAAPCTVATGELFTLTDGTKWKSNTCISGADCKTDCETGFTGAEYTYKCETVQGPGGNSMTQLTPPQQQGWCVKDTDREKFPFRVEIIQPAQISETGFSSTIYNSGCAGALIAPSWVLAAGHCYPGKDARTFFTKDEEDLGSGTAPLKVYMVLGGKRSGYDPAFKDGPAPAVENIANCFEAGTRTSSCPTLRKLTKRYTISWKTVVNQGALFKKMYPRQKIDTFYYHDLALYKLETPLTEDEFKSENYLPINVTDVVKKKGCDVTFPVFRWDKHVNLTNIQSMRPWQPISNTVKSVTVHVNPHKDSKYVNEGWFTKLDQMWLNRTEQLCTEQTEADWKALDPSFTIANNKCLPEMINVDKALCSRFSDKLNCFDLVSSMDNEYCVRDSGSPGLLSFKDAKDKSHFAHTSSVSTGWGTCGSLDLEQLTYTPVYAQKFLEIMGADAATVKIAIMKDCTHGEICKYGEASCKAAVDKIFGATDNQSTESSAKKISTAVLFGIMIWFFF